MDINASVDIGQNLTGLVTKLAEQIGVTADKVFPWYVKQQVIEGWCMILIPAVVFLACLFTFIVGVRLSRHTKTDDVGTPLKIIGGVCCVCAFFMSVASFSDAISRIKNPEYHATKAFLADVGNLVPGK